MHGDGVILRGHTEDRMSESFYTANFYTRRFSGMCSRFPAHVHRRIVLPSGCRMCGCPKRGLSCGEAGSRMRVARVADGISRAFCAANFHMRRFFGTRLRFPARPLPPCASSVHVAFQLLYVRLAEARGLCEDTEAGFYMRWYERRSACREDSATAGFCLVRWRYFKYTGSGMSGSFYAYDFCMRRFSGMCSRFTARPVCIVGSRCVSAAVCAVS